MGMFTSAMNGIKSAPGSVKNGVQNAYGRSKLANRASFSTGSRMISGAMEGGIKGLRGAWDASSRKGQSGIAGSMAGMAVGAGLGYGASPDGWGGAGAAGGAAAGLFGGARVGNMASAFMRGRSSLNAGRAGLAGPQPSMMNRASFGLSKAYAGAGSAWGSVKNGANDIMGRAGQSMSNMKGEWAKRRGA